MSSSAPHRRPVAVALAVASAAALVLVPAAAAAAESAADAERAAAAARAQVRVLSQRVTAAQEALAARQDGIQRSVSAGTRAEMAERAAEAAAEDVRRAQVRRVRALYMGGVAGLRPSRQLALWRTAVSGGDVLLAERARRVSAAVVVIADDAEVRAARERVDNEVEDSFEPDNQAYETIAAARELQDSSDALTAELARAEERLDALSVHARTLAASEETARVLAAARETARSAAAAGAHATSAVRATAVAADYAALYAAAAATCPGMRVSLLTAVGQVESGHGRHNGPSSAGAVGPMQFMPATFAAYGVDGDGDGTADPWAPADAVHSAAHYLCRNGAGAGRDAEARALHRYNHADWYVRMVQRIADELDTGAPLPR